VAPFIDRIDHIDSASKAPRRRSPFPRQWSRCGRTQRRFRHLKPYATFPPAYYSADSTSPRSLRPVRLPRIPAPRKLPLLPDVILTDPEPGKPAWSVRRRPSKPVKSAAKPTEPGGPAESGSKRAVSASHHECWASSASPVRPCCHPSVSESERKSSFRWLAASLAATADSDRSGYVHHPPVGVFVSRYIPRETDPRCRGRTVIGASPTSTTLAIE
jgi:hypothetical protein